MVNFLCHRIALWFRPTWWCYLLARPRSWRAFWCRARGHPYPVVWFNLHWLEPDMHCTNCGDDLG
jgi:hypothetical protein